MCCTVERGFMPIHGVSEDMFSHSAVILHIARPHLCEVKISCCLTHTSNESLFSYVHSVHSAWAAGWPVTHPFTPRISVQQQRVSLTLLERAPGMFMYQTCKGFKRFVPHLSLFILYVSWSEVAATQTSQRSQKPGFDQMVLFCLWHTLINKLLPKPDGQGEDGAQCSP